jgi:hypothetical protein
MQLLPAATRPEVPWKNGGGTTSEVAIAPADAGVDDFDWRVSIARIDTSGPFSCFPDVDRTLLLLTGGPVALEGPNWQATLREGSPPLLFDGADTVDAQISAPSTDLNVMSRRGRYRHMLSLLPVPYSAKGVEQLVIALSDDITCDGVPLRLLDAILLEPGDRLIFDGPENARLASVSISRS